MDILKLFLKYYSFKVETTIYIAKHVLILRRKQGTDKASLNKSRILLLKNYFYWIDREFQSCNEGIKLEMFFIYFSYLITTSKAL